MGVRGLNKNYHFVLVLKILIVSGVCTLISFYGAGEYSDQICLALKQHGGLKNIHSDAVKCHLRNDK